LLLSEKYRIYIFLIKFKSNLKVKILDIDSISNICNKFLTIIIIQEQTLNCTRKIDANSFENQQITKNSDTFSDKSNQNCCSDNINKFIRNKKYSIFKNLSILRKQIYKISNANYLSRIKYFEYYKKRYYKKKYFN